MPVTVTLLDVIAHNCPRNWWPQEFASIAAALEENPNDRTPWGILADWCTENNEPDLARAFRFVNKRPEMKAKFHDYGSQSIPGGWWTFEGMPTSIAYSTAVPATHNDETLISAAAGLALKLKAAIAELE